MANTDFLILNVPVKVNLLSVFLLLLLLLARSFQDYLFPTSEHSFLFFIAQLKEICQKQDVSHENQREINDTALWAMQATPKAFTEGIKMKGSHESLSLSMKYNSQDTPKSKHFIYLSLTLFFR